MKRKLFCIALLACFTLFASAETMVKNPIKKISQAPGLCCIFHSWGYIGDSLSSGEHEYHKSDNTKGFIDLYEYSWGQRICAATGTHGDNYSQGGETARGWIKNFWDSPKNNNHDIDAKANPKQAYIVALGVNDANSNLYPLGNADTDVDKADFNKNAKTFAGYYAGIIQRVKSIQPEAKIFVVTLPRDKEIYKSYNVEIRKMAKLFGNVYVIDLEKYAPSYKAGSKMCNTYFLGGHLNAAGYQYTAWMFMTYIDKIIRSNMKDFEQAAFIGTGLRY